MEKLEGQWRYTGEDSGYIRGGTMEIYREGQWRYTGRDNGDI